MSTLDAVRSEIIRRPPAVRDARLAGDRRHPPLGRGDRRGGDQRPDRRAAARSRSWRDAASCWRRRAPSRGASAARRRRRRSRSSAPASTRTPPRRALLARRTARARSPTRWPKPRRSRSRRAARRAGHRRRPDARARGPAATTRPRAWRRRASACIALRGRSPPAALRRRRGPRTATSSGAHVATAALTMRDVHRRLSRRLSGAERRAAAGLASAATSSRARARSCSTRIEGDYFAILGLPLLAAAGLPARRRRAARHEPAIHRRRRVVAGVLGAAGRPFAEPADPQRLDRGGRDRRGLCRRSRPPPDGFAALRSTACAAARSAGSTSPCRSRKRRCALADAAERSGAGAPARPTCCCSTPTARSRPTTPTALGLLAAPWPNRRRASTVAARPVVILGAGGAARGRGGGAAGGRRAGGRHRQPHARARGRGLAAALGARVHVVGWAERRRRSTAPALSINATTLGLGGGPGRWRSIWRAAGRRGGDGHGLSAAATPRPGRRAAADGLVDRRRPGDADRPGARPRSRPCSARRRRRTSTCAPLALAALGERRMIAIGLTGSIGMGKSTTAAMFAEAGCAGLRRRRRGAPALRQGRRGGRGRSRRRFPASWRTARSTAPGSAARVLGDPEALKRLNGIVYPLLGAGARAPSSPRPRRTARDIVVLDIPLLFETGGEARHGRGGGGLRARRDVQRERVLARPAMSAAKLDAILARQMPDEEKRARAHFVIDTSQGFDARPRAGAAR